MNNGIITVVKLHEVVKLAKKAGQAILKFYENEKINIEMKQDDSPVTEADLASHHIIMDGLQALFDDIPILSEESTAIAWQERKQWKTYWLIDPLDGTKEFISKNGEFTVNIALIHKGKAIAGVVYAPVLDKCYYGAQSYGAWLLTKNNTFSLPLEHLKSKRVHPIIVGSRSHISPRVAEYLNNIGEHQLMTVGSSLKFCMLAEGIADIYPRLGLTCEWDTAAAQAVLDSAGGCVINYGTGAKLKYNQKEELLNPWFIAYSSVWRKH